MLQLSKISTIVPYSDEWWTNRIGKLTSSKIHTICGERGIGEGGKTYIRSKVAEVISGTTSERDIANDATRWGQEMESKSLRYYMNKYNREGFIVVDKHIIHDELFSGTPDAIDILASHNAGYECETIETKSYITYATHMEHCECDTALQIKSINKPLFWQVISQMLFCDTLVGNAIFYHPDFPIESKLHHHKVVFRKKELLDDFRLLKNRMEEARTIYNKLLNKFK